jgi:hypothetical protein
VEKDEIMQGKDSASLLEVSQQVIGCVKDVGSAKNSIHGPVAQLREQNGHTPGLVTDVDRLPGQLAEVSRELSST